MCRPSCCRNDSGPGAGIAAVAILMVAALIAAKIGPIVAHIIHVVLEVIRLAALATGLVVALAVLTWTAIHLTRWQQRRRALIANPARLAATRPWEHIEPSGQRDCLACCGSGTGLRAIGSGRCRPKQCPVCEPARRAG